MIDRINDCLVCGMPAVTLPDGRKSGVCSLTCSDTLVMYAKKGVRNARDAKLIDQEEYYQTMRKLNLA